ncbi:MAG: tyrosine-type recombinase/integrase [Promethearchaeota archaeon]
MYLSDCRLKKPSTSEYVFTNPQGGKLNNRNINTRIRTLSKKLKFRIHPHKFRVTYATHLYREIVSVVIISLLLGHESIETTMRYISVSESEKREAQQKATYLGKLSDETQKLERLNREKEDLIA